MPNILTESIINYIIIIIIIVCVRVFKYISAINRSVKLNIFFSSKKSL